MKGTIVNALAVVVGGIIGLVLNKKLPARLVETVFQGIGLITLFFGISMAMQSEHWLVLIVSVVTGGIIGELLDLNSLLSNCIDKLKRLTNIKSLGFSDALITSFLLFCMGSMTVLGAMEEGINKNADILFAKSVMDGISATIIASAMGIGVLFSVIPLLIYQGLLTVVAGTFGSIFPKAMMNEVTAAGGIILIGLSLSLLKIKEIKTINLLPSLLVAIPVWYIFHYLTM